MQENAANECAPNGNVPSSNGNSLYTEQQQEQNGSKSDSILTHLQFPTNCNGKNLFDVALAARKRRVMFLASPDEREPAKINSSGRMLTEPEILAEKHEPELKQLVPAISQAMESILQPHSPPELIQYDRACYGIYETSTMPALQLEGYIHRIAEYTYVSPSTLLASVILLDRFASRHPFFYFTQMNVYKLFFVATRVASKVIDLRALNNRHFASVGGISNKHLNELEARFLTDLHFDIHIFPEEFTAYANKIVPKQ